MGRAIHKFKTAMKYMYFILVILQIIWNPQIQGSTNTSNVIKARNFVPTKLNDFTVQQENLTDTKKRKDKLAY